jgi:ferredoxin
MNASIYYHSGTGNSLWTARKIAEGLSGAEVIRMPGAAGGAADEKSPAVSGTVGLVFPVHIWGVPTFVRRFAERLKDSRPDYLFAVAVNAGQVSATLVQLKNILAGYGLKLSSGFELVMPSNYIPWGGPGPVEKRNLRFRAASEKIGEICSAVSRAAELPVEKGPLWQRILFTAVYKMSYPHVREMDGKFRTDEKCDGCGICAKVCPVSNVTMTDGKPAWNHRCLQCLACLQWCPKESIQYGKKTPAYERYRHPEVRLKDMLVSGS